MDKNIKNKFPNWCNDNNNYSLCLSDDIDSLSSCIVLNILKGYKISYFYTFNALYATKKVKKGNLIGVDVDLTKGKCWGNHVTLTQNKQCANLNVINKINTSNYYSKYCGSTLLQILSYYNVKLDKLTEKQLEILICVDTAFKQYFFNKDLFTYYYRDVLEYPQFVNIVSKHSKEYFYNIIKKYNLHKKIYINKKGYLTTNINLAELSKVFSMPITLPTQKFYKVAEFNTYAKNINNIKEENIFSLAVTNKNFCNYSILKKGVN